MADIRCSHCGKDNPDFFDVCQFCQSPLKSESMLHIGEEPTKRDTGELEEILPEWLKDARQQGKEEAADDGFLQNRFKVQKDEPPDLLAGLMSQSDSDNDEVPDWLTGINPGAELELPAKGPLDKGEKADFFAQFGESDSQPLVPPGSETQQDDLSEWTGMEERLAEPKNDLTDLSSDTSQEPVLPFATDESKTAVSDDNEWMKNLQPFDATEQEPPAQKEPEDLSWLHELEAASKGTDELSEPLKDEVLDAVSSSSGDAPAPAGDDLSIPAPALPDENLDWLNKLGGTPLSSSDVPTVPPPALSDDDDMEWLNKLGGTPVPSREDPAIPQEGSPDEDMDWLNKLGAAPAPAFDEPVTAPSTSSDEDLSWLNDLGGLPEPAGGEPGLSQSSPDQADLNWLKELGATESPETPASVFAKTDELKIPEIPPDSTAKPFRTAPLNELLKDEEFQDKTPEWLKNAMEEPSMPPPGAVTLDWLSEHKNVEEGAPAQEEPVPDQPAFDFSSDVSAIPPTQQDVDSLFDVEMPDWLSRKPEGSETAQTETSSAPVDDTLSPVELPSWVQAMRPVDSAIGEVPASAEHQIIEREGPLAGFRGVIPSAPIGSSLRPKALSLKLQVTEEQQASASLLEQIIADETFFQPSRSTGGVTSQGVLRRGLAVLFLVVLSIVIGFGSRIMPIVPSNQLSELVATIPESSSVLIVVDYEPPFAGELEAAAGPLLDQLALSRRSTFTFVTMSPNGFALVDRLMFNAGIRGTDILDYQPGVHYFNLGFLPGGSTGVLGFIEKPQDEFTKFAAVLLMTDNAESGRVWVEQLGIAKGKYPEIAGQPLIIVSSAQSGPLLQPYVSSGQVDIMIDGLYGAAKYEAMNTTRPGTARAYWDAFGVGLMMAIVAIILGSSWSVLMRIREPRAQAEQG